MRIVLDVEEMPDGRIHYTVRGPGSEQVATSDGQYTASRSGAMVTDAIAHALAEWHAVDHAQYGGASESKIRLQLRAASRRRR